MTNKLTAFSMSFQYALVRLMLEDETFFLQASKYFKNNVFETDILWFWYEVIRDHYREYNKLPGDIVLHTELKKISEEDREQYKTILLKILSAPLEEKDYIRHHLRTFVKANLFASFYDDVADLYNKRNPEEAYSFIEKTSEELNAVNFEEDDTFTPNDIMNVLNHHAKDVGKKVKTGLKAVDEALGGGAGAGEVFTVLARDGIGKSMFLMNVGAIALMEGKKVLHIHCEGKKVQPILRYCSRCCWIEYKKVLKNNFNSDELMKIQQWKENYGNNLLIKPFLGLEKVKGGKKYTNTIQDVIQYCSETYKKFPFDVVIIDYGDKLDTRNKTEAKRFVYEDVWRGMESIAAEFNVPVYTASQAQRIRGSGTKPLKRENIAEAYDKSRLSAFVMSINRSSSEIKDNKIRFLLDKDREGPTNVTVICSSDYAHCCTHILENQVNEEKNDEEDIEEENINNEF